MRLSKRRCEYHRELERLVEQHDHQRADHKPDACGSLVVLVVLAIVLAECCIPIFPDRVEGAGACIAHGINIT